MRELRADPLNSPAVPLSSAGFLMWGGEPTASGERVDLTTALQTTTVFACARVIAESLASLPLKVMERVGSGTREAENLPLSDLLGTEPNPEMTAFTFVEALVFSMAITGAGYAEIQRDKGGRAVALWPLHPRATHPRRDPKGNLYYETSDGMESGQTRKIAPENMIHIPMFSFDGISSLSPIDVARQGIGLARAAEKFGARYFGNNTTPNGILSTTDDLNDEELKAAQDTWKQTRGGQNQGGTAVLHGNWKFEAISLSPEQSQFLQVRQFQRTEICAIFRVPPHMVGDTTRLSNNNTEQQNLSFVIDTLKPYACRIEAELTRKLLPSAGRSAGKYFVIVDFTERLRGDFKTQMEGYSSGRQWGYLSGNDIRKDLGLNPGGAELDIYFALVNMQDAKRLLTTESIQDQPIGSDPTPEERNLLGQFSASCIHVWRDGIGRLANRNKRDFEAISSIFKPVLRSIANLSIEKNGLPVTGSPDPADTVIDDALKAIEKRAAKWPEKITDADLETLAQSEFTKAVRSIHINITREIAASKAVAALADGKWNEN